jgi:hypothetical protein
MLGMDVPAVIGVMIGFGLVVVVPIVAIMTNHQHKMARIMQGLPEDGHTSDDWIAKIDRLSTVGTGATASAASPEKLAAIEAKQNEILIRLDNIEQHLRSSSGPTLQNLEERR